jgi:8-oxo-dGTP pyrophosphatase MutT (NUDIX family)
MIQRRNSLSFVELIRGKYDVDDSAYIKHLMSLMTVYERKILHTKAFDTLWNEVWFQAFAHKQLLGDYSIAKSKFERLRTSGAIHRLLAESSTKYYEPEWGFPKGRRRLKERDIDCAIREFCEETGLSRYEIYVDEHTDKFEEIFYGTNDVLYCHLYYIAKMIRNVYKPMHINYCNIHQAREVQNIKWFTASEVLRKVRDYNPERKRVFLQIVKKIKAADADKDPFL